MSKEHKSKEKDTMKFDMPSCGGCSTCELACSFHHKGEFDPSVSSLKIVEKENGPGYKVLLVNKATGESMACDGCKDRDVPLCVEYCKEADDLMAILLEFEKKREQEQS